MFSKTKLSLLIILLVNGFAGLAQDTNRIVIREYDPHTHKIIPDKVFEIGLPLLFLFMIANTIVTIFKIKAEARLKEKAIDKGISEPSLIALFGEDKNLSTLVYLKWFLVLGALGVSLMFIHSFANYFDMEWGYLALGIISTLQAVALFIYYLILRKR